MKLRNFKNEMSKFVGHNSAVSGTRTRKAKPQGNVRLGCLKRFGELQQSSIFSSSVFTWFLFQVSRLFLSIKSYHLSVHPPSLSISLSLQPSPNRWKKGEGEGEGPRVAPQSKGWRRKFTPRARLLSVLPVSTTTTTHTHTPAYSSPLSTHLYIQYPHELHTFTHHRHI